MGFLRSEPGGLSCIELPLDRGRYRSLHEFTVGGTEYGVEDPDWPRGVSDERAYTVGAVLTEVKDKMMYEYDFGDGWRHRIVLEKILEPDPAPKLQGVPSFGAGPGCAGGRPLGG